MSLILSLSLARLFVEQARNELNLELNPNCYQKARSFDTPISMIHSLLVSPYLFTTHPSLPYNYGTIFLT